MELYTDERTKEKNKPFVILNSNTAEQFHLRSCLQSIISPTQMNMQSIFSISTFRVFQGQSCINIQSIQDWTSVFILNKTSFLFYVNTTKPDLDTSESLPCQGHLLHGRLHVSPKGRVGDAPIYLVSNLARPLSWLFVSLSLTARSIAVSDGHGGTLRGSRACIFVEERGWMPELPLLIRFSKIVNACV